MTLKIDLYAGKKVWVVGLGRSGLSTAKALTLGNADVHCWDDNESQREKAALENLTLADPSAEGAMAGAAALFLSPGIPHTFPEPHAAARSAKEADVPILGDIDLLLRACPEAQTVGVTGTNGKSTTTALIGHILKEAGCSVSVGGNLGYPVLDLDEQGADGIYVLELSSYQLELCENVTFDVSVLLNIGMDHLDRHGGIDGYVEAKTRIFSVGDVIDDERLGKLSAVVGIDDDRCAGIAEAVTRGPRNVVPIAAREPVAGGVYGRAGRLIDDMDGVENCVATLEVLKALPGDHNAQNAAAAVAACRLVGLSDHEIGQGLKSFPGLPHRLQRVAEIDGVLFVNDSKATNAEAAMRGLASYDTIYWIAGGRGKEGGYDELFPHLGRVQHAYLIGEAANDIELALAGRVPSDLCDTLGDAVANAYEQALADAKDGAVVLLSPACASFDQFKDFEARGWAFCRHVAALPGIDRVLLADIPIDQEEAA